MKGRHRVPAMGQVFCVRSGLGPAGAVLVVG